LTIHHPYFASCLKKHQKVCNKENLIITTKGQFVDVNNQIHCDNWVVVAHFKEIMKTIMAWTNNVIILIWRVFRKQSILWLKNVLVYRFCSRSNSLKNHFIMQCHGNMIIGQLLSIWQLQCSRHLLIWRKWKVWMDQRETSQAVLCILDKPIFCRKLHTLDSWLFKIDWIRFTLVI